MSNSNSAMNYKHTYLDNINFCTGNQTVFTSFLCKKAQVNCEGNVLFHLFHVIDWMNFYHYYVELLPSLNIWEYEGLFFRTTGQWQTVIPWPISYRQATYIPLICILTCSVFKSLWWGSSSVVKHMLFKYVAQGLTLVLIKSLWSW